MPANDQNQEILGVLRLFLGQAIIYANFVKLFVEIYRNIVGAFTRGCKISDSQPII
jgi:hypothetical protein